MSGVRVYRSYLKLFLLYFPGENNLCYGGKNFPTGAKSIKKMVSEETKQKPFRDFYLYYIVPIGKDLTKIEYIEIAEG